MFLHERNGMDINELLSIIAEAVNDFGDSHTLEPEGCMEVMVDDKRFHITVEELEDE
jgi:hypothetical protein